MRFSDNGRLAYEELFGREGFSGPSSLIYHRNMPEGAQDVSEGPADLMTPEHEQVHTNAHLKGFDLPPQGDVISGRRWLLVNDDVHIGLVAPVTAQQVLYVNGSADEVLFVHAGSGSLRSQFGHLAFKRHDYIVVPRGTIYRIDFDDLADVRLLCMEVTGLVDVPDRYRARNGQITEMAPYSERDFHGPDRLEDGNAGPAEIWLKRSNHVSRYVLDHHPVGRGWMGRHHLPGDLQHPRLRAARRTLSRATADPPDVPGAEHRDLLVRAAQAGLGSGGDPSSRTTTATSTRMRSCITWKATTPRVAASARDRSRITSAGCRTVRNRERSRHRSTDRARPTSWR